VIAACNRDLAAECDAGRFRSDLYWRLNVMPLALNPLATRRGDVIAISAAMLIALHDKPAVTGTFPWPTAAAMASLAAHSWPGNARELGNVLQRAIVLRDGDRIDAQDLSIAALAAPVATPVIAPAAPAPVRLQDIARASKLDAIRHALRETDGHRALAARKLGISERTLRYRLAELREMAAA
jgi:two-component system response regulator FlrC